MSRGEICGHFFVELAEAFFKSREAAGAAVVADGLVEGSGGGKNPHMAFRAGNGGVDEVALQHHVVAGIENHDDGGVFAALALVDGAGVGEL